MSAINFIETVINEMNQLLIDISTGKASLQREEIKSNYIYLRDRLLKLAPLVGGLPRFIEESKDGFEYWKYLTKKEEKKTYDSRREFLKQEFTDFYTRLLGSISQEVSLPDYLIKRDLLIEREIGAGGFGIVYEATHITLECKRAIKIFDPAFYQGEDKPLRRFIREVSILATLNHPNIIRLYDAGIVGNKPFIITEFVSGDNLDTLIKNSGCLSKDNAFKICYALLDALEEAHTKQVYHRDIKPSNIMWNDGVLKLLDFGAGTALVNSLSSRMTTTTVGTPGYISPELFENPMLQHPGIDIYSVGVTLHYLLTGHLPNPADISYLLRQYSIDETTIKFINKALLPIDNRYQSAKAMKEALRILQK